MLILTCFIVLAGCFVDVDDEGKIRILYNITITQEPNKTTYYVKEKFDPAGLVVTAYYWDDSSRRVTDYSLSKPDMDTAGTKTITVSYLGMSSTFNIAVIAAPLEGVLLNSITVTRPPVKTTYFVNEEFDADGLVITAAYNDDSSDYIIGYSLSKPDMSTTGTKTININYLGKTTSFDITVIAAPQGVLLNSITVTQPPVKTTYYVNEAFSSAGLVVTAAYSDGSSRHVTGYLLSMPNMSSEGTRTINVSYEGKTTTFNITIIAAPSGVYLTSITVTKTPVKNTYYVNEVFNPAGLIVTANYSDGSLTPVTGYSLSTPNMSTAGTKTITATYEDKTTTFNITVIAAPSGVYLTSITVTKTPAKTTYYVDEAFNPAGLVVTANYSDGSLTPVTGYSLSTPNMSTAGTKTITATYEGKTANFNITVIAASSGVSLTSITVTKTPAKTTYYVNEAFNPAGLVVTAAYSDSSSRQITGYSLSTPDMSAAGTKTITVTFEGKATTFNITVNPQPDEGGLGVIIY